MSGCSLPGLPGWVPRGDEATTTAPTESAAPTPSSLPQDRGIASPSAPTEEPLPDLVVAWIGIELEAGGACTLGAVELGTRVTVRNAGPADAGPFVLEVNEVQQAITAGLASGESLSVWLPDYRYGNETTVKVDADSQVRESDETNNALSQMVPIPTLPPTCTPTQSAPPASPSAPAPATPTPAPTSRPTATPPPAPTATPRPPAVTVREGQIAIATYPYASFTSQEWNETFGMAYPDLDWAAYRAANPVPVDTTYRTLVMENEYLRITFLPDLGGRIYEVFSKPTGHRETYRNPVLKPSPWGPPEQGWWLAAGGIEWCLPVEEHGYEWGLPWTARVSHDGSGATVILRDTESADRVRAEIAVRLEAQASSFTIRPRLENPTGRPVMVKYWTNAMLAPGGLNAPTADLRFVLPNAVTSVTVHSRGDESLPGYNERMPWPTVNSRDLSRLGNWTRWLGFFEDPAVGQFMAVYDEGLDEGMIRVFPPDQAPGAKVFGFGWSDPIPPSTWTDDNSSYVELHGGAAPTFDDSVTLPAGGALQWTETWYPVAGLGGLRHANSLAAINLEAGGGQVQAAIAVTHPWSGTAVLLLDGQEIWRNEGALRPGQPLRTAVSLAPDAPQAGRLTVHLVGADGTLAAEYSADFWLK